MGKPERLTPTQWQLLTDLAALEDAGMIHNGSTEYLSTGYYDGDGAIDVPPVVSPYGRRLLEEGRSSHD